MIYVDEVFEYLLSCCVVKKLEEKVFVGKSRRIVFKVLVFFWGGGTRYLRGFGDGRGDWF